MSEDSCHHIPLVEFLCGDLAADQTELVARHLEECEACRERLQIMAALQSLQSRKKNSGRKRLLLAAASLLLVLLTSSVWLLYTETFAPGLASLATEDPYPFTSLSPRSDSEGEKAKHQGLSAYAEGRYQEAAQKLQRVQTDEEALFYLAVSNYMRGRDSQAFRQFRRVVSRSGSWEIPARWYLANALLRLREREKALEELEFLARHRSEYQEDAAALIRKISGRP